MSFRGDRRGVTVQVGAILLLGFVVISLSLYQATVVPSENKQVEFRHSQTVQDQMIDARNALLQTAAARSTQPVAVDLGTRYPARTVFINPPPPAGAVRTADTTDPDVTVAVSNASSPDPEVGDYWNGSTVRYRTGRLVYRPGYNVYDGAPTTVYEHTLLYSAFDGGATTRLRSGQALVDGRRIHVVLLNGSLRESGVGAAVVEPRPLSVSSTVVTLRNDAEPMNVTLPTRLPASQWREALAGETAVDVTPVPGADAVNVTLRPGTTYELKVSRIGVGRGVEDDPEARYLTLVDGPDGPVTNDTAVEYTVEVRDRYNNPVSGVQVNNTTGVTANGLVEPETATSNADGRATFSFTPRCPPDTATCEATLNLSIGDGNQPYEAVEPSGGRIQVESETGAGAGGGGVGSDINPNSTDGVVLRGSLILSSTQGNTNPNVNLTLQNRDENRQRQIVEARFNFYSVDRQSGSQRSAPEAVDISNRTLKSANNGGQFRRLDPINLSAGDSTSFTITFYSDAGGTTEFDVTQGDFFIISVVFADGETATYFVAPADP
jgi:hypothetical protein